MYRSKGLSRTTELKRTPMRKVSTTRRRTCKHCGERFTITEARLTAGRAEGIERGKYCSAPCRSAAVIETHRNKPSSDRYGRNWRKDDREWSKAVRERDGYACQWPGCGVVAQGNHAHHRLSRSQYPHRKHDVTVGVTLCPAHHRECHAYPARSRELGFLNPQSAKYERERRNKRLA